MTAKAKPPLTAALCGPRGMDAEVVLDGEEIPDQATHRAVGDGRPF